MLEIAKRAFINYIRNKKTMVTFIIFPIILMSLLGVLLSSAFSTTKSIGKIDLYYYSQNANTESTQIIKVLKENSSKAGITFKEASSIESGKNEVKLDGASFVIFDGKNIDVYNNVQNTIQSTMVNEYIGSIIKASNAITESFKMNPIKTETYLKSGDHAAGNITVDKVPKKKEISSYAYYAVAELTLFALYISIVPLLAIDYDERKGIKNRLKLAGFSDLKYYLGNSIGYFFVSIILTLPGYLFAQFVLGVDWGNPIISYGSILLLTITCVMLGQVVSAIFNNAQKSVNIIKAVLIPILAFLGGAYMPIANGVINVSGMFDVLTKISPLRWINLGLMNYMTDGTYTDLGISAAINIGIIIVFIIILAVISKRRERA